MLAHILLCIVDIPELRPLVFGIPLAELIPMRENAFLGAGFLFVPARSADGGIELSGCQGVEQCDGLQLVAAGVVAGLFPHASFVDGFLDGSDGQVGSQAGNQFVPIGQGFGEIMPRVDMHQAEGYFGRPERLPGQVGEDDGVFPAGKKDARPLELRRHLAEDENRLRFQLFQMGKGFAHIVRSFLLTKDTGQVFAGKVFAGLAKQGGGRPFLDYFAQIQEHRVVGNPAGLMEGMRYHDD